MQFVKHFTTQRNMERSAEPITYVGDHQLMPPSATNLLYSEICKELAGDSMLSDGYHLWKKQKGFMNGSALGNVGSIDWSTALSHDRMRWTPHSTPPKKRMRTERSTNSTSHLNSQMLAVGTEAPSFVPDVLNDLSNQSWNTMCLTEPRADLDLTSANLSWSSFLQQTLLDELIVSEFSFSPSSPKECVEKADEPLVRVASDIIPQLSPDALSNVPFRDSLEDDLGTIITPVLDETALPHIFSPNSTLDLDDLDRYLHSDSLEHEWADLLL